MTTDSIPYFQVDAFTGSQLAGNPAGVCPLEEWLPTPVMQMLAARIGLSETAFFVREGECFSLRWFTPVVEVDLCGHGTLASAFVLFQEVEPSKTRVQFETKSGRLLATRIGKTITLDFPARAVKRSDTSSSLTTGLGKHPKEVYVADNGITLCVFENEEQVRLIRPDFDTLAQLRQCILITAPGINSDFVSRYFAPNEGIPEDPVTGSAHCILAPFWAIRLKRLQLKAHQVSKRGGELFCEVMGDRVFISGEAVLVSKGRVFLPAAVR